ncbi:MAG: YncE family protein [Planctomycetes bacterium]|nr:YncE family protein [Planctomycetota bacterium]
MSRQRTGGGWRLAALSALAFGAAACGGGGGGGDSAPAAHTKVPFDDQRDRSVHWDVHPLEPLVVSKELGGARLFALNQPGARLASFDPATLARDFELPIGPGAVSLAERPGTQELWISDRVTSSVTVVDRAKLAIVATIRVGAGPHGLAFSANGDRCYVACADVNRVDVLDPTTYSVVKSLDVPVEEPRALVCVGGVVWVAPLLSGNGTAPVGASASGKGVDSIVAIGDAALPDRDLIAIPVTADPQLDEVDLARTVTGLGSVLFNLHARPGTNELWIPNTDALNTAHKGQKNFVAGQVVSNRLTIVDTAGLAAPRVVDLDALAPAGVRCAQPTGLAFDPVRPRVYVCGYGSDAVAVLDLSGPAPTWAGSIALPNKQVYPKFTGPRTCAVDASGQFLFVFNKGDNSLSRVALASLPTGPNFAYTASSPVTLGFEPTSGEERQGRNHFINARNSKSLTTSCASCHVDGHTDGLLWELSDFLDPEGTPDTALAFPLDEKGPLVTSSTRRQAETAPFHWRGEKRRLVEFNATFVSLMERHVNGVAKDLGPDFRYLEHYIKRLAIPANPRQQLDRSLTPLEQRGADVFAQKRVFGDATCASCHELPLGTSGEITASHVSGMFAQADVAQLRGVADRLTPKLDLGGAFGVRTELGAGLTHGGAYAGLRELLLAPHPTKSGAQAFELTKGEVDALVAFLSAFDTGLAPSTAYQATATPQNLATFRAAHLDFLLAQAELGHCDLIFRDGLAQFGAQTASVSGLYDRHLHAFRSAREADAPLSADAVLARVAQGRPITFLGVPGLMGRPMAIDRDMDGLFDLDELDRGTDPEALDTDLDQFPDGYEVKWGLDPLVPDASSPDTDAPGLVAAPKVIYTTTNTVKFEFETDEVCRVQISYNGGIPVQRLPLQNDFDFEFSVVLNELEPATFYAIDFELKDPAGNVAHVPYQVTTKPRAFGDPTFVDALTLAVVPGGGGDVLTADVALRTGSSQAAAGVQVTLAVYLRANDGTLSTLTSAVGAATGADGHAQVQFALPPQGPANPGELFAVVRAVAPPAGAPAYFAAQNRKNFASIAW